MQPRMAAFYRLFVPTAILLPKYNEAKKLHCCAIVAVELPVLCLLPASEPRADVDVQRATADIPVGCRLHCRTLASNWWIGDIDIPIPGAVLPDTLAWSFDHGFPHHFIGVVLLAHYQ